MAGVFGLIGCQSPSAGLALPIFLNNNNNKKGEYLQPSTTLRDSTPKRERQNPESLCQEKYIIKYSLGLPQDTEPLRSCSGNPMEMQRLKTHLVMKCHSQYIKVIRILLHSPANRYCMGGISLIVI